MMQVLKNNILIKTNKRHEVDNVEIEKEVPNGLKLKARDSCFR